MKIHPRLPLFIALSVALFLSGCALHKAQVSRDMIDMPAAFVEAPAGDGTSSAPLGRWWEQFGDQKLNALMEEMLTHNLDVAQAYARLAQLQELAGTSDAGLLPFLNIESRGSRNQLQSFLGETTGTNHSLSFAAGYELDLWKKIRAQSSAAHLEAIASREDIKALYMTLTAQLADLYYLAVEQRAQIERSDDIVATLSDSLERVERRYRQGLSQPLDVYQARQNLMEAKENRPQYEKTLAQTNHAIALLLGRFPEQDISGELAILPDVTAVFPTGLPAQLMTRRPDIEAEFLKLSAKDARIGAAVADRFPAVNLLGNYGKSRSEFGSFITSGIFWDLIADLAMPVIDGGRRKAEVGRVRAVYEEELASYMQTVQRAVSEVEDALVGNYTTKERLGFLSERNLATEAGLRLATSDYYEGLTDYLPVLLAQQLHFRAQVQLLSLKRQLVSDRISLMRALGGTWMEEDVVKREAAQEENG